jgi:hypothetical protein
VPLERNCVRFIDNFSAGTRGAMSTEQFLQVGPSTAEQAATTVDQTGSDITCHPCPCPTSRLVTLSYS